MEVLHQTAQERPDALGPLVVPQARRILMLGGGGYSVPKWLLSGGAGLPAESLHCTVVELDPAMTQVARDYFALPVNDPRLRIVRCIRSRTPRDGTSPTSPAMPHICPASLSS